MIFSPDPSPAPVSGLLNSSLTTLYLNYSIVIYFMESHFGNYEIFAHQYHLIMTLPL